MHQFGYADQKCPHYLFCVDLDQSSNQIRRQFAPRRWTKWHDHAWSCMVMRELSEHAWLMHGHAWWCVMMHDPLVITRYHRLSCVIDFWSIYGIVPWSLTIHAWTSKLKNPNNAHAIREQRVDHAWTTCDAAWLRNWRSSPCPASSERPFASTDICILCSCSPHSPWHDRSRYNASLGHLLLHLPADLQTKKDYQSHLSCPMTPC